MLSLGNKLTLNTQPIYHFVNKRSIVFDGVDDCIITDGADTVAQPTTYSFWCKSSQTGSNLGVFGHGKQDKGGFHFNFSSGGASKPLLWLGNQYYRFWNDIPQQDDGEWHHWVVYSDTNDVTNSKLYVDGVLQTVNSTATSGSLFAYTESLTIGGDKASGGNHFEGNIDEFAVFDRELTQEEITRMYNTYYSPNRVANGNFNEIGVEEVTNGDFSQIGSEEITNGDFSQIGAEEVPSIVSIVNAGGGTITPISGNSYSSTSDGTSGSSIRPKFNLATTSGKSYKLTITPTGVISGTVDFKFYDGSSYIFQNYDFSTIKEIYFTDNGNVFGSFDGTETYNINSFIISVKQVDPNDNWTLGTGWSFGENKALYNGVSEPYLYNLNPVNIAVGDNLKITFVLDSNAKLRFVNENGSRFSGTWVSYASGTHEVYLTSGIVATQIGVQADTDNGAFGITNISVIQTQQTDIPRLDYTNGTASILLEPQSTNLIAYSEDFSQSVWTKNDVTVTSGFLAPDGLLNAYSITEDTSNSTHYVQTQNINVLANKYTFSAFIKSNGRDVIRIQGANYFSGGTTADFNLTTKTIVLGIRATNGKIEDCGNGWFRCSFTSSENALVGNNAHFRIYLKEGITYTGDGSSGVFVWGAQIEAQSYATSYIPTSGSAVTRAAETLKNAGNSDLINSTEGVLYAEIKGFVNDALSRPISISDGTTSNRINLFFPASQTQVVGRVNSGGVTVADMLYTGINQSLFNKIAVKYKENDFALWINGIEVLTDTSGAAPVGLKELAFDNAAATKFQGRCKTVAVFKEALSDTELACLTSTNNREIFLNYYYRMQYVGANTEALSCAEQTFNI